MSDRLGQDALSEEPSDDALRAQYEWEEDQRQKRAEVAQALRDLERVVEDALGEEYARERADRIRDYLNGRAA